MDTQTPDVFNTFVHLTDDAGVHHAFGPGDPVPGWARPLVGDHVIHTGESPAISPVEDWPEIGFVTVEDEGLGVVEPPKQPPTSGPGSNRTAWAEFAKQVGQPVLGEWSRQDIIDALIRNGHIRE